MMEVFLTLLEHRMYAMPARFGRLSTKVPTLDFSPRKCQETRNMTERALKRRLFFTASRRLPPPPEHQDEQVNRIYGEDKVRAGIK